jgi:hypothetical protein
MNPIRIRAFLSFVVTLPTLAQIRGRMRGTGSSLGAGHLVLRVGDNGHAALPDGPRSTVYGLAG